MVFFGLSVICGMMGGCAATQHVQDLAMQQWQAATDEFVISRLKLNGQFDDLRTELEPIASSHSEDREQWHVYIPWKSKYSTWSRLSVSTSGFHNTKYPGIDLWWAYMCFNTPEDCWFPGQLGIHVHGVYLGRFESGNRRFDLFMVALIKSRILTFDGGPEDTVAVRPVLRMLKGSQQWVVGPSNPDAVAFMKSNLIGTLAEQIDISLKDSKVAFTPKDPGPTYPHSRFVPSDPEFKWEIAVPQD